jgi:hypothetical protein
MRLSISRNACRRALAQIGLFVCALGWPQYGLPQNRPQESKPSEYEVEAAYLSNFGRFVEWTQKQAAGDPFNICVYGPDPFGSLLDGALRGENIGGASLTPRRIATSDEVSGCRILFISQGKENQNTGIILGIPGVLTVSDSPGFCRRGGMIEFIVEGNRVRFEINLAAAQRAGLTLSSQLLKLAIAVRRSP